MYNIIKDLHEHKDMTIVMVTHDIDAATKYATRVLDFNSLDSNSCLLATNH